MSTRVTFRFRSLCSAAHEKAAQEKSSTLPPFFGVQLLPSRSASRCRGGRGAVPLRLDFPPRTQQRGYCCAIQELCALCRLGAIHHTGGRAAPQICPALTRPRLFPCFPCSQIPRMVGDFRCKEDHLGSGPPTRSASDDSYNSTMCSRCARVASSEHAKTFASTLSMNL